jgi:hypothetical protein
MDIPILTITGHYDADQKGAMLYYRRHLENAEVLTFVTIYFLFK